MAREDLNPVEEARACAVLVEELGLTREEVGRRVGRSRVAVSNLLRLLDLPDEALELLEAGELTEGHGRALLLCKDHADRRRLARAAARRRLVGARDRAPRPRGRGQPPSLRQRNARKVIHPDLAEALAAAEDTLAAALGRAVKVRARGEGCCVELDFEPPGEAVELAADARARRPARRLRAPGRRYNRRSRGHAGRRLRAISVSRLERVSG